MKYQITKLYTYPIKSLKGVSQEQVQLSPNGFAYDRFWMLARPFGRFITQREIPALALFETAFTEQGVLVKHQYSELLVPFDLAHQPDNELTVSIFGKEVNAQKESAAINAWFSEQLKEEVILVRQAKGAKRLVNRHPESAINFPDGHQFLVIGEASLDGLNQKLDKSVPMNRFRPNIVFSGGIAHEEDQWMDVQIGDHQFAHTKNCGRCKITTIDQTSGVMGQEPLKTLATYRMEVKSITFGRYLKLAGLGKKRIEVGDEIIVK